MRCICQNSKLQAASLTLLDARAMDVSLAGPSRGFQAEVWPRFAAAVEACVI